MKKLLTIDNLVFALGIISFIELSWFSENKTMAELVSLSTLTILLLVK